MKSSISIITLLLFTTNYIHSQGNCLNFDGVDDYVQIDSPLSGDSDFTVEAWFIDERTNNNGHSRIIGWNGFELEIAAPNGILRFYDSGTWLSTDINIRDDQWHHVALTREGTAWKFYLDGTLLLDLVRNRTLNFNSYFRIGSRYAAVAELWQGSIDEVRVWNSALSEAQILNNKNNELNGDETHLVGYWNFNQGIASGDNTGLSILDDSHLNSNDGILNSFLLMGNTSNWVSSEALLISNQICLSDNNFTGAIDSNWDNPLNWTEGCVPTSPYEGNIIIQADCEISSDVDFVLLVASTFTINSGVTLVDYGSGNWSFAGTLTNNGTLEKPSITNTGTYKGNGILVGSLTNDGNIIIGSD